MKTIIISMTLVLLITGIYAFAMTQNDQKLVDCFDDKIESLKDCEYFLSDDNVFSVCAAIVEKNFENCIKTDIKKEEEKNGKRKNKRTNEKKRYESNISGKSDRT